MRRLMGCGVCVGVSVVVVSVVVLSMTTGEARGQGTLLEEAPSLEELASRVRSLEDEGGSARAAALARRISRLEETMRKVTGLAEGSAQAAKEARDAAREASEGLEERVRVLEQIVERLTSGEGGFGGGLRGEAGGLRGEDDLPGDADGLFERGLELASSEEGRDRGRSALLRFMEDYGSDPRVAEAHYWVGETWRAEGDFREAATSYLRGWRASREGARAPDNMLKLGMSLSALGETEEACASFRRVLETYASAPERVLRRAKLESAGAGC